MDDAIYEKVLSRDLSVGTERFRDELLRRCLEVLGSEGADAGSPLEDDELEYLAAAGVLYSPFDDAASLDGSFSE